MTEKICIKYKKTNKRRAKINPLGTPILIDKVQKSWESILILTK